MILTEIFNLLNRHRRVFLLDAIGACLSSFLLGVVLVRLESVFGIPSNTLYFLAFWPILFVLYDMYCFLRKAIRAIHVKLIAYLNVAYCFLSFSAALLHLDSITSIGWIYIIAEIIVVLFIAYLEIQVGRTIKE